MPSSLVASRRGTRCRRRGRGRAARPGRPSRSPPGCRRCRTPSRRPAATRIGFSSYGVNGPSGNSACAGVGGTSEVSPWLVGKVRRSAADEGDAAGGDGDGVRRRPCCSCGRAAGRGRRTTRPAPCRCRAPPTVGAGGGRGRAAQERGAVPVAAEDHAGDERLDHHGVQPGRVATRRPCRGRHGRGAGGQPAVQGDRQDRTWRGRVALGADGAGAHPARAAPAAGAEGGDGASCPRRRSTTGSTSDRVAVEIEGRGAAVGERGVAGAGVLRLAGPRSSAASRRWRRRPSRLSSAWTYSRADDLLHRWRSWRSAATAGWASRASIVSRPWIVDSAPEFGSRLPSGATPSKVMPVAGS